MNFLALLSFDARPARRSARALLRRRLPATLLACAALVATALHATRALSAPEAKPSTPAQATQAPQPMLLRKGEQRVVPDGSPLRARLAIADVTEASSARTLRLPATVEADPARTANIVPPLTGTLTELKVQLGDTVRRGQVLAVMSAPDFAQAVADEQKARDALDLAQRALARARGVHEAGSNADKDVEAAASSVTQQTAELRRSEARLRSIGGATAPTASKGGGQALALTAPMAGTVTALNVSAGAHLNDASASLITVSNLDTVWVTVNVPESQLAAVVPGQQANVELAAYPGRSFSGKVAFVSPLLDADTRRARARIAFANTDGALKPNMFATAVLAAAQTHEPQLPASALLMNNDSVSVFVEVAPWTFVRRTVELGREDEGGVRIRQGLAVGERVVVRGGVLLND